MEDSIEATPLGKCDRCGGYEPFLVQFYSDKDYHICHTCYRELLTKERDGKIQNKR